MDQVILFYSSFFIHSGASAGVYAILLLHTISFPFYDSLHILNRCCVLSFIYIYFILCSSERERFLFTIPIHMYLYAYQLSNQSKAAVVFVFSFISLILFILEQTIFYCRPLFLCLFTRVRSLNHPLPL